MCYCTQQTSNVFNVAIVNLILFYQRLTSFTQQTSSNGHSQPNFTHQISKARFKREGKNYIVTTRTIEASVELFLWIKTLISSVNLNIGDFTCSISSTCITGCSKCIRVVKPSLPDFKYQTSICRHCFSISIFHLCSQQGHFNKICLYSNKANFHETCQAICGTQMHIFQLQDNCISQVAVTHFKHFSRTKLQLESKQCISSGATRLRTIPDSHQTMVAILTHVTVIVASLPLLGICQKGSTQGMRSRRSFPFSTLQFPFQISLLLIRGKRSLLHDTFLVPLLVLKLVLRRPRAI